jgi:phosphoribosylamine--glycine ligase
MVRLRSDLFQIFQATIEGNLRDVKVEWDDQSSACVVLASDGYPGPYETGITITGLNQTTTNNDVQVFHAGTSKAGDGFATSGGRVLGITSAAATLEQALANCYGAIDRIQWQGMQYRRDIGQFGASEKS